MCLIIDVNVAHKILLIDNDPDFRDIHQHLFAIKNSTVKIIYSQKLITECTNAAVRRIIGALDKAGRAKKIGDNEVESEIRIITEMQLCKSNDHHIIALARVGNVRLLCSHDQNLHSDFTNKNLLNNPRGKVYQNTNHKKLLRQLCNR